MESSTSRPRVSADNLNGGTSNGPAIQATRDAVSTAERASGFQGDAGGRKCKEKSEKWYGEYRTAGDTLERVPLAKDKAAASTMLNELEINAERLKAGRTDQFDEHGKRPLAEHVEAFGRSLDAKGGTAAHVAATLAKLRSVFAGCDFHRLTDLSAARVADFLASARQNGLPAEPLAEPTAQPPREYAAIARAFGVGLASVKWWRRQGAPIVPRGDCDLAAIHRWRIERSREPMSIATSNHYLTAAKGFGAWLVRDRRWPENPLAHLSALNAEVDLRRERRALSADEFGRLVEAARVGATFRGMSGPDRALLYIVAANTGLRAAELASLSADSFDLDADPPTITVEASYSKHRRRDVLPLRGDLIERICPLLSRFNSEAPGLRQNGPRLVSNSVAVRAGRKAKCGNLWPGSWYKRAATMLRLDLDAAGVAHVDTAGRVFDFHALRHQFLSDLARAGVHPKEAQALARHSTITLTMDRYTHLGIFDLTAALDRLPALPTDRRAAIRTDASDRHNRPPGQSWRGEPAGRCAIGLQSCYRSCYRSRYRIACSAVSRGVPCWASFGESRRAGKRKNPRRKQGFCPAIAGAFSSGQGRD